MVTLVDNSQQAKDEFDRTVRERMGQAVELVKVEMIRQLSQQGTGRQYRVPGTKNTFYTASAPGEPPAAVTGDLKRSITTEVSPDGYVGVVGSDVEYAPMLEFGTMHILPRPFVRPSFEAKSEEIKEIFTEVVF